MRPDAELFVALTRWCALPCIDMHDMTSSGGTNRYGLWSLQSTTSRHLTDSRIAGLHGMVVRRVEEGKWIERVTSLTVTTRSEVTRAPFRIFTAGPLMEAQLGYSQDRGSYLCTHRHFITSQSCSRSHILFLPLLLAGMRTHRLRMKHRYSFRTNGLPWGSDLRLHMP